MHFVFWKPGLAVSGKDSSSSIYVGGDTTGWAGLSTDSFLVRKLICMSPVPLHICMSLSPFTPLSLIWKSESVQEAVTAPSEIATVGQRGDSQVLSHTPAKIWI